MCYNEMYRKYFEINFLESSLKKSEKVKRVESGTL